MTTLAGRSSGSSDDPAPSIVSETAPVDVQSQRLDDLQTPLGTLDVLHELESWGDDLLCGGDCDAVFPDLYGSMMALQAPSFSSPHVSPRMHVQSFATSGSCSRSRDKSTSGRLYENMVEAASAAPVNKQRVPRKVEIAQLHDESALLEKQLYELSEHWKKNVSPQDSISAIASVKRTKWKQIASRQKELLAEAKHRSLTLRNEYAVQRKIVRHIRRVLMSRATSPIAFDRALYVLKPWNPLHAFEESHQTFQMLLHATNAMLQELAYAMHIITSRSQANQTFREWQVQEDQLNGMFLELVDCYELPFDCLEVNRAMRRFYGEGSPSNSDKIFCEHFQGSGDLLCRQVIHAYSHGDLTGYVRHREAVCNLNDAMQSVFVSTTLIQPVTASGEPIRIATLREQKWTVVHPVNTGVLATGYAMSVVQTFQKVGIESVNPANKVFWTRSVLLERMVPMWDVSLGVNQRRLEKYLIEQGALSRARHVEPSGH